MTEPQLRTLFALWKRRLGLDRWRLELCVGGLDVEAAYMQTSRSAYYERAVIYVQPWLLGIGDVPSGLEEARPTDDDFVSASLVHELLHLHTRDMRAVVRDDLCGAVHQDHYRQLENSMQRAEEQCVDRLAEALVRAFAAP